MAYCAMATQAYEIRVPWGAAPGDTVEFSSNDSLMRATIPDDAFEGDMFVVTVESARIPEDAKPEMPSPGGATPNTERVYCHVPDGASPGDAIEVQANDGQWFSVEVPTGAFPGMSLEVDLPLQTERVLSTGSSSISRRASSDQLAYSAHELRVPQPVEGYSFYRGQHVQMLRSNGQYSNGVILEVLDWIWLDQPMYRCRIGDRDGLYEKNMTDADISARGSQPGFDYAAGDVVLVPRKCDGRTVLATVLEPIYANGEPSYRLRLDAQEADAEACHVGVELHSEEDVKIKMLCAPRGAFVVGQLVQVRGEDGSYDQLARVVQLDATSVAGLTYVCRFVPDGWGLGTCTGTVTVCNGNTTHEYEP